MWNPLVSTLHVLGAEVTTLDVRMPFQNGRGERTGQSESAACPPHPLSHTIDMAFGD
jgi:hypothetical protein